MPAGLPGQQTCEQKGTAGFRAGFVEDSPPPRRRGKALQGISQNLLGPARDEGLCCDRTATFSGLLPFGLSVVTSGKPFFWTYSPLGLQRRLPDAH